MKLKADNLGCGECRMKAAAKLRSSGAKKVSFDLQDSFIIIDEGNLTKEECIQIIEKESIYIERSYSENLIVYMDLDEVVIKELTSALQLYKPVFELENNRIQFSGDYDEYDIEELIYIYGYHIKKIVKPY